MTRHRACKKNPKMQKRGGFMPLFFVFAGLENIGGHAILKETKEGCFFTAWCHSGLDPESSLISIDGFPPSRERRSESKKS
jgi:hypothetical protein